MFSDKSIPIPFRRSKERKWWETNDYFYFLGELHRCLNVPADVRLMCVWGGGKDPAMKVKVRGC